MAKDEVQTIVGKKTNTQKNKKKIDNNPQVNREKIINQEKKKMQI